MHQDNDHKCTILSEETLGKFKGFGQNEDNNSLIVKQRPALIHDSKIHADDSKLIEIYAKKLSLIHTHLKTICKSSRHLKSIDLHSDPQQLEPEIVKIIDSGPQGNRIDVVFMGDGYTAGERQQFFDDIGRLTKDMFEGDTFQSYLPLFNIWAIYVPSQESGIGYNGPKNTPFKLYRESGQLRAIYPGNATYARQV